MPFLEARPRVAVRLAAVLAGRLRRLSDRMEDAVLLPLSARLARQLLRLAGTYGTRTPLGGTRVEMQLPQQRLGELIGGTRESVNKLMRQWIQDGLITVDRRDITLRDVDGLRAIAEQIVG
jgi:CRP-like cAMP-binding protein